MEEQIRITIKEYMKAFYKSDYEKLLSFLDKKETDNYVKKFIDFADQMDVFGETDDFLKKIKIDNLASLKALSTKEFMTKIFSLTKTEIGEKKMNKLLKNIKIIKVDVDGDIANVKYSIPVSYFGEVQITEQNMTMTQQNEGWKIHFKSGLDTALSSFQEEINLFYKRKSKDNLTNLKHHPNDLEKVTLVGYKNMNGDIVFEPRFKDGGDFSEEMAYVKVMNKYGYIDKNGEIVIKPAYIDAKNFSEQLAAVELTDTHQWGFINRKGKMIIEPKFDDVSSFNHGFCAVQMDDKWGYIDKTGKLVIPCIFHEASDFWDNEADVTRYGEDEDEFEYITINKEGKRIDEEE